MSWLKVDDKIHAHPKFKRMRRGIRLAASGLWMHAGAWAAAFETDGEVPQYILEDLGGEQEHIDALIESGLWHPTEDGIVFHDWAEYQPTRDAKKQKRATEAERVRKWRQNRKRDQEKAATSGKGNAVRTEGVTHAYASPDPTRPDPARTTTPPSPSHDPEPVLLEAPPRPSRAKVYPDGFELFWKAYPRKDDKAKALTVWRRVTGTDGVPNEDLVAGAEAYRDDPNRVPQYTKLATTWLNAGAWENGPLPPRGGPGGGRPDAIGQGLDTVARLRAQRLDERQRPQINARRTA